MLSSLRIILLRWRKEIALPIFYVCDFKGGSRVSGKGIHINKGVCVCVCVWGGGGSLC